jgi:hypothetical protein
MAFVCVTLATPRCVTWGVTCVTRQNVTLLGTPGCRARSPSRGAILPAPPAVRYTALRRRCTAFRGALPLEGKTTTPGAYGSIDPQRFSGAASGAFTCRAPPLYRFPIKKSHIYLALQNRDFLCPIRSSSESQTDNSLRGRLETSAGMRSARVMRLTQTPSGRCTLPFAGAAARR